jgi:hypothetical protein
LFGLTQTKNNTKCFFFAFLSNGSRFVYYKNSAIYKQNFNYIAQFLPQTSKARKPKFTKALKNKNQPETHFIGNQKFDVKKQE